eukprot:snap_masked-scaffold129_size324999-processed-gene-2.2 protein:Tk10964 transcript:snap_masked-scaffold129_size324999-processed-gene-2.2-mRNA-1 annotation:"hypothetical protein SPN3US_0162"
MIWSKILILAAWQVNASQGSCCNDNYWCDGDPSFIETPDVRQDQYEDFLRLTWTNTYLRLSKCVDFFYVEYCQVFDGEDVCPDAPKIAPVAMQRDTLLDDWEDPITPLIIRYGANITVDVNTEYLITVFAVDKGAGWGESEGKAIVSSKPIFYQSRAFIEVPPHPQEIARRAIDQAYPPQTCSFRLMCAQLAQEWISDVANHTRSHYLRYHDPEFLPPIDIRWRENRRIYEQGRLLRLSQVQLHQTQVLQLDNGTLEVSVTLNVRMIRVSYWWQSFFTHGMLSLYHTCGEELPIAIFQDVDVDEVEKNIAPNCAIPIKVFIEIPIKSTKMLPKVHQVTLELRRSEFKYDVTWFSKHFHNLDMLWEEQISLRS